MRKDIGSHLSDRERLRIAYKAIEPLVYNALVEVDRATDDYLAGREAVEHGAPESSSDEAMTRLLEARRACERIETVLSRIRMIADGLEHAEAAS